MDVKVIRSNGYSYVEENVAHIYNAGNFTILKKEDGSEVPELKPVSCIPIREDYHK